jgi:uncharacterized membrane protein
MSVLPLPSFRPEHVHPILVNFTASLLPASFISDVFRGGELAFGP